jgi:hypothetical protein
MGCGLSLCGSVLVPVVGCCEHGKEPSASQKFGEFLDYEY